MTRDVLHSQRLAERLGQPAKNTPIVEGSKIDDLLPVGADEEIARVLDEAHVIDIFASADQVEGPTIELDVEERECRGCHLDDRRFKCAADDANRQPQSVGIAERKIRTRAKGLMSSKNTRSAMAAP